MRIARSVLRHAMGVCRTDAFIQRSDKSAEKQKQHARGILGVKAMSASEVSRIVFGGQFAAAFVRIIC